MNSSLVYLVQTDTTVGFSSSDDEKLSEIKQRPKTQKILQTVNSFKTLNKYTRVPKKHRKKVRNANSTTFIYPNGKSFRVIDNSSEYITFVNKFSNIYSTSANLSGKAYDEKFAFTNADLIVFKKHNFSTTNASKMIKLYKKVSKTIR